MLLFTTVKKLFKKLTISSIVTRKSANQSTMIIMLSIQAFNFSKLKINLQSAFRFDSNLQVQRLGRDAIGQHFALGVEIRQSVTTLNVGED
jgi:hypothetical protein